MAVFVARTPVASPPKFLSGESESPRLSTKAGPRDSQSGGEPLRLAPAGEKEEEVYWRLYDHPAHCRECLEEFRQRYNRRRPHWVIISTVGGDPLVPEEVYAR